MNIVITNILKITTNIHYTINLCGFVCIIKNKLKGFVKKVETVLML